MVTARRSFAIAGALGLAVACLDLSAASAAGPQITRIAGADRYETAARVSETFSPFREVYIATGENFPDSLAAGPLAGGFHAPILLVTRDAIPAVTAAAIQRLHPTQINVVGGPAAISDQVLATLNLMTFGGRALRFAGADRYETAVALTQDGWPNGSQGLLIATGRDFPDALLAGAVGAVARQPLLLVDGQAPTSPAVLDEVRRLHPESILLSGDENAISPGVVAELAAIAPVSRVGGNAFNRGAIIYSQLPAGQFNVVLVTGLNFPDGLTAAAFAGAETRALTYLVPGNCVPPVVASEITRLNPPTITIIGGSAAVTPAVESLTPC